MHLSPPARLRFEPFHIAATASLFVTTSKDRRQIDHETLPLCYRRRRLSAPPRPPRRYVRASGRDRTASGTCRRSVTVGTSCRSCHHQQVPAEPLWLEVVVVVLPRVVVPSPRHDPAVLPRAPPRLVLPGADVDPRRGTTEVLLVIVLVVGAARARDPGAFPTPSSTRPFLVVVSSYRSLRTLPPLATRRAPAQHQAHEDPEGGARRASRPALDVPQRALDLAPPVHRARRDGPVEHLPGAAVSSPVRPLLF